MLFLLLNNIGFPLISAGIFGYPVDQAWQKALQACADFIGKGNEIDIVFAVLNDGILDTGTKALKEVTPQYSIAIKGDWQTSDMPAQHDTLNFS